MKRNIGIAELALTVGLMFGGASATVAGVVYNNYANDQRVNFDATGSRVGDEVVITGTSPALPMVQLSQFQFDVFAQNFTGNPIFDADVQFYANDGPLIGSVRAPGTMIWDSGVFPIRIEKKDGSAVVPQDTTYYNIQFDADFITNPGIVPSNFTWTVEFSNPSGTLGLRLFSPPTVGGNYPDYWLGTPSHGTNIWTLNTNNNPNIAMSFAAEFQGTAVIVPEPSSIAMSACVVLGISGYVVRRRQLRAKGVTPA